MSSFINLIQGRKDFFWLKKEFKKDILEKNKRAIEMRKKSQAMLNEFFKIQKENKLKARKKAIEFKKDILSKRKQAIELKKQAKTILDGYEILCQLGMKIIKDNKSTK
jgi:hypothetical protein